MKFVSICALFLVPVVASPTPHTLRIPLHSRSPPTTSTTSRSRGLNKKSILAQLSYVHSKYASTFAAYKQNTGIPHPLSTRFNTKSVSKRATDVPLVNDDQYLWYGPIQVGTPPKEFTVVFDTGSADLFLPSIDCPVTCDGHARYDPNASSSSKDELEPFVLVYGTGETVGKQYTDNVYLQGYKSTDQIFGSASIYSTEFSNTTYPPDGLSGLAFPSISSLSSSPNHQPLFTQLAQSAHLPHRSFSFKLSSTPGASELLIGGDDKELYDDGTLVYVPVSVEGYWQVVLDGISRSTSVAGSGSGNGSGNGNGTGTRNGEGNGTGTGTGNGEMMMINGTQFIDAIVDTGTTLIVTTDAIAKDYYAGIPGAEPHTEGSGTYYTLPCTTLPSVTPTLTFAGHPFAVSPDTFNLGDGDYPESGCLGGIAGSSEMDFTIVGDVFLQNVYSIFDYENKKVGFAKLV